MTKETEQKKINEELEQKSIKDKKSNELKDDALDGVVGGGRGPVTTNTTYTQI